MENSNTPPNQNSGSNNPPEDPQKTLPKTVHVTSIDDIDEADSEHTVIFARKPNLDSPAPSNTPPPLPQTPPPQKLEKPFAPPQPPKPVAERIPLKPALPRDRFAAFLLDILITNGIFLFLVPILDRFLISQSWFLEKGHTWHSGIHAGLWALIALVYSVLFEMTLGATIGKLLGRLRVVDEKGDRATVKGVLTRNVLRLVDYPLFFVTLALMERSTSYQRLGDRLGQTVVIKKTRSRRITPIDIRQVSLALSLGRIFGFFLDLIFVTALCLVYLSALNPSSAQFNLLAKQFPVLVIVYFLLSEFLTSTTPGKQLIGNSVILENGEPLDATSTVLRNLARPLDLVLGYPLVALTRKKQRLGDLLADTFVIRRRSPKAWMSVGLLVCAFGGLGYLVHQNPRSDWLVKPLYETLKNKVIKGDFSFFGVSSPTKPQGPDPKTNTPPRIRPSSIGTSLKFSNFILSHGPSPATPSPVEPFYRQDPLYTFFKLSGFKTGLEGFARIQQDIQIENPEGKLVYNQQNNAFFYGPLPEGSHQLVVANLLRFPKQLPEGRYAVFFILKDLETREQLVLEKTVVLQEKTIVVE